MVKDGILHLCDVLKPDFMGVIDAMAPPDYVVDSVLGRSDGKVGVAPLSMFRVLHYSFQLYENIQSELFHGPGAMARPNWWHEIIIKDAPDFVKVSNKL